MRLPRELIDVELAFSRVAGKPKEYVQDRIRARPDPSQFGPANQLRLLWVSYFLEKRTAEMLAVAGASSWRVITDSARLIERLMRDPVIGSMRLVTLSGRRG